MKKIILLSILILVFGLFSVNAWLDCAPAACAAGEIDNGVYCTGGTCYRNCSSSVCTNTWSLVHNTECGWDDNDDEEFCTSPGFTVPSNSNLCYNFSYIGPDPTSSNIRMSVDQNQFCDTEAIGGFWDATNRANPWFSQMYDYLGTTPGHSDYNYLLKAMRAHTPDDVIGGGGVATTYRNSVSAFRDIFCAPTAYACTLFGGTDCATSCYGRTTEAHTVQGYFEIFGGQDRTLYNDRECGNRYVSQNKMLHANNLRVYAAPTTQIAHQTSCDRINELPVASNVRITPSVPNAGDDLECIYDYFDPEGYDEQNTLFSWWENGINQNINSPILKNGNISVGESWRCMVSPGDGLTFGAWSQSNVVTIQSTISNLNLFLGNTNIWNYQQSLSDSKLIDGFEYQIDNALDTCIPDAQGYCTLIFSSNSRDQGVATVDNLQLFYTTHKSLPLIQQHQPANNFRGSNLLQRFMCSATSTTSSIADVTLFGNWSQGWHANHSSNSGNLDVTRVLPNLGHFKWNCKVTDAQGNVAWGQNRTLSIIDTQPPEAPQFILQTNSWTNQQAVQLEWQPISDISGIQQYEYSLDGGAWVSIGLNTSLILNPGDGVHSIYVRAIDNANNIGLSSATTIRVDTTSPPLVTILDDFSGWLNNAVQTISWQAVSDLSGIANYEYSLNNGVWNTLGVVNSATLNGLADGIHNFVIRAIDTAGNIGGGTEVSLQIDTQGPNLHSLTVTPTGWINQTTHDLSWSSLDELSGVSYHEYSINNGPWNSIGNANFFTTPGLTDGQHNLVIRAVDNAGNIGNTQRATLLIDTQKPIAIQFATTYPQWTNIANPLIVWNSLDDKSIVYYESETDNGNWINQGNVKSFVHPTLADGLHTISVRAIDRAGNVGASSPLQLQIDTLPPPAPVLQTTTSGWSNQQQHLVTWNAVSDVSGVSRYEYQVDGGTWQQTINTAVTLNLVNGGIRTVSVRAIDGAGNVGAQGSTQFNVDFVPPEILTEEPVGAIGEDQPIIRADFQDDYSGININSVVIKFDGQSVTSQAQITEDYFEFIPAPLSLGIHDVAVEVWDNAGNQLVYDWSFEN